MNPHAKESYCAFLFDEPEFYESFMREIVEAIEQGKANTHLLNNLGIMHWETGDPDQAMECLEKAVAIDPKNAIAFKNIGMLAEKQGNNEGALPAFQKAVRLKPNDYSIQLDNAYLLLELDRACEAIPYFKKAIALGFDNEVLRKNLAKARAECGQPDPGTPTPPPFRSTAKSKPSKRSTFLTCATILLITISAAIFGIVTLRKMFGRELRSSQTCLDTGQHTVLFEEWYGEGMIKLPYWQIVIVDKESGQRTVAEKIEAGFQERNPEVEFKGVENGVAEFTSLCGNVYVNPPTFKSEVTEDSRSIPWLMGSVESGRPEERVLSARELGKIGPVARRAVPVLEKALKDEEETVRQAAAEALKKIKSAESADPPEPAP